MKATLVFTGADGSMGLRRGQTYVVEVRGGARTAPFMVVPRRCPYGSWEALWRNWRPVPRPRVGGPWRRGMLAGDLRRCPARQVSSGQRCQLPWPHPDVQHDRPFA